MCAIKLIIFDLDGTLVDAYGAISRSFNYCLRRLGYPAEKPLVIRRAVGWGDVYLLKPFVRKEDLPLALEVYRGHHAQALRKFTRLLPQVKKTLSVLKKQGVTLAIASNRPTRFARIIIRHLGLDKYVDYTLCADKAGYPKPHPRILQEIMRKFRVNPGQTLYVGDMAIDAQAGRRAKINTVIVTTGSSSRKEILKEKPYKIARSFSALTKCF